MTTCYIGSYYEVTGTTSGTTTRQYYYAGAQRLAVRETRPGYNYVSYFLPDHLGSNTITASPAGMAQKVRAARGGWPNVERTPCAEFR